MRYRAFYLNVNKPKKERKNKIIIYIYTIE